MWLWTTAAPAAKHRSAPSAISAGSFGVFGFCFLLVTPLIAASMITGSAIGVPPLPRRTGTRCSLLKPDGSVQIPAHRPHRRAARAATRAARLLRAADDTGTAGRAARSRGRWRRVPRPRAADGDRRLARGRLAEGVRRAGADPRRTVHLLRRGPARRRPHAPGDAQHGRPHAHALRQ